LHYKDNGTFEKGESVDFPNFTAFKNPLKRICQCWIYKLL